MHIDKSRAHSKTFSIRVEDTDVSPLDLQYILARNWESFAHFLSRRVTAYEPEFHTEYANGEEYLVLTVYYYLEG